MAGSSSKDDLFAGKGEAAALMRAIDWSKTPLGPTEGWARSLKTIVPIMLASRFAMRVLWGRELIFLYNDAYRPVLGASKHPSAMGRRTRDSFAELWHIVGPLFERVLAGESIALEDTLLPLERNGYLEECYFTLSYSPLLDDEGAIGGVLGVVHEVTDRVIAERRLRTLSALATVSASHAAPDEMLQRAADVLAQNPSDVPFGAFYTVDEGARRARLVSQTGLDGLPNARQLSLALDCADGWSLPSALPSASVLLVPDFGARFGELRVGEDAAVVHSAAIVTLSRPGAPAPYAFFIAGISPRRAYDDDYRTFLELAAEHIAGAVEAAIDREERDRLIASERAARTEAERSNAAKDEFLAIVSHELRNPLSAMLGWTHLLRRGHLAPEKRDSALETIERNAFNQSQLIEDLLDISRIVSGKFRIEVKLVNFVEVVQAALESARPAIEAKQLRLAAVIDNECIALMGDATRLQQVVWNILTNATKFTPRGGSIQLVVRRVDSVLELSVTDSGAGISAGFLPQVFERFKQADPSTTRTHGGLGIGLSIAKNLVEMHGGSITAHSDGIGSGATFVVRLPVAAVRPASAPNVEAPARAELAWETPPELAGLRVLVVDDEPDARDLVKTVLEQCGSLVFAAASAREALHQVDAFRPEVLLSDIGMPGDDGYWLIRQIRSRPTERGGALPAGSLTAYAGADDRRRALVAGFNMHVPKPVEPVELVAIVASLGRLARALR